MYHFDSRQLFILVFIIYYSDLGECLFTKILEKNVQSGSSVFRIMVNCLEKEYGDIMSGKRPKTSWTSSFIHTDCVEKSLKYLTVIPVRDSYVNITIDCEKLCLSFDPAISVATATYECPNNAKVVSWTKKPSADCMLPYVSLAKQYHCETYDSIPQIFTRLTALYSTWILTIPAEFILRESPGIIKYSMDLKLDAKPFTLNWNRYKFDVFIQLMPYALRDRCQISPRIGMVSASWFYVECLDLSKFSQKGGFYYSIFYQSKSNTTVQIMNKKPMMQKLNFAFQLPYVNQTQIEVSVYVFNQLKNTACFETKAVYTLTVHPFSKAKSLDAEIESLPSGDRRVAMTVTSSLVQAINEFSKNTTAMANVLSPSELQSRRDKNSWRREKMLESMMNIKLENVLQNIQLVKLVNNLISVHTELTQAAHRSASDLYEKFSLNLKKRSTTKNVKIFAKDLITGIGSLLNLVSDIGGSLSGKVRNAVTNSFVDVATTLVNSTKIVGQGLFKVGNFSPGSDTIKVPDMTFGFKAANSNAICQRPMKESLFSNSKFVNVTFSCSYDPVPNVSKLALSTLYMLQNPFSISGLSAKINFPVLSVNIFNEHFNKMVLKSVVVEFSEPKDYFKIEWINQTLKFPFRLNGTRVIPTYDNQFSIPSFQVTSPATSLRNLFINIIKGPFELDIVVQYKQAPTHKQLVTRNFHRHPESKIIVNNKGQNYSVLIPSRIGGNDTYHILTMPLENYTLGDVLPFISNKTNDTIFVHMQIGILSESCFFWDSQQGLWSTDGCIPMLESSHNGKVVKCECLHLSILSASLLVLPNLVNPIDDSYLFLRFFDNPIVFAAILNIWTLYFCLLYWCYRKDRSNKTLAIITVLADDLNGHIYLIGLRTRWLPSAGTTAKIFLILFGTEANSTVHYLRDAHKPCFQTGDESWFLLTTEQSIGELQEVSIWHDNSGPSPDWRLDRVVVQDFESKQLWVLICPDWISMKRGLKSRHVLLAPLTLKQLRSMRLYQFRSQTVEGFRNSHQWMSILLKTPHNSFTHTQRLTCAFNLLLAIMLGNIMFYGIPTDDPEDQILTGPIQVSLKSLVISIETSLVLIPIGFFLTKLFSGISPKSTHLQFRKKSGGGGGGDGDDGGGSAGVKTNTENPVEFRIISSNANIRPTVNRRRTTIKKNVAEKPTTNSSALNYKDYSSHVTKVDSQRVHKSKKVSSYAENKTPQANCENDEIIRNHDNRFTCSVPNVGNLPWWFIYIAWIINILFCLVSTYFTVLYGFKYGQQASFDWLCSFFFTFFQSAIFEQPAGIILRALLISVLLTKRITLTQFSLSTRQMDDDELLENIQEHCHFEEDFTFDIPTPRGQRLNMEIKTNEK